MKSAAIYIRKSREDKDKPSHRLTVQREQLPAYAAAQGWSSTIYDDGHASAAQGKTESLKERARLETDIRAGNINLILTIELSRLSRDDSLQDYVAWLDLCSKHGVRLATMSRILDPAQHSDWMLLLMEGGFSSVEMRVLKARMNDGWQQAYRAGKFLGGTPPPPYIYDHATGRPVIDPDKLPQMTRLWNLAETLSAKAIAEKLKIPEIAVRRAISDDRLNFYQAQRINEETGEIIACDWEPCMFADQAQRIRSGRRSRKNGSGQRAAYSSLLSAMNLVYCGYCGGFVKTWQGPKRGEKTPTAYYSCSKKNGHTCPKARMFQQPDINSLVVGNLLKVISNLDALKHFWDVSRDDNATMKELAELTKKAKAVEQNKQRLVTAIAEGVIEFADAKGQMQKLNETHDEIKSKQQQILSQLQDPPDWDALAITTEEFHNMDMADQREILRNAITRIDIYNSYAIITYPFPRNISGNRTSRIHLPPPRKRESL
jgi:DNA invertase Pin-like site-specific DNA recombinase